MKMTHLFRKQSGVLALLYATMMLIWLVVIICLTMLCCDLPWNFYGISLVLYSVKIDFNLNWRFIFLLLNYFTNLLTIMLFTCKEKRFIKSVEVKDEVQNIFVKSFQSISGLPALLKISARCGGWTLLNRRLVQNNCRLPDQNRITGMWLS